ncbi:endolytic transglycosylase MltG [Amphibacillus sp. Q70]|uniref:endolytic transglycosylase MltG n=1 Tax=Amphibacillus sp. Q70 TaxID=3453416 RepID=UPI003F868895
MSNSKKDQNQMKEENKHSQTNENKQSQSKENNNQLKHNRKERFIQRCREASTVRKIVFGLIVLFTVLIIFGGKSLYDYVMTGLSPADPDNDELTEIEVPLGSSSSTIANILEEEGIINDGFMFRLYIKVNNYADFQAGEYELSPSMTLAEVSETLQTGSVTQDSLFSVTIPEGRTIEEIAELYENSAGIDSDEFIGLMQDEDYISELIELYPDLLSEEILQDDIRYPLEGYLFAATYPVYEENPEIDDLVRMMLDKSSEVLQDYYPEINELEDFSVHDVMTFASLIEREARDEEERKLISGVFYNRLEEGMRLETDPTVLYAHGEHKDRLLLDDLEIESPYNTYHIHGLPIGPISNFGTSSLEAVLEPTETDYLFFVAAPDGEIYYSETFKEHVELANRYLDRDV